MGSRMGLVWCLEQKCSMPPEIEEGNVEYKLKLKPETEQRRQNLTSQLRWRLTEHGECYYVIGVDDDGTIVGIFSRDLDESLTNLEGMCRDVGAMIVGTERRRVSRRPELYAAEVCIRLEALGSPTSPETSIRRFPKVAFVGETGSGKSTLIGVLTAGAEVGLDNGQGSVRLGMLRHRHELISGQTSSVAVEFLPFDPDSKRPIHPDGDSFVEPVALPKQRQLLSTPRVAQLVDLAGDRRYQRTTYAALTTWTAPDWLCVVIPATAFTLSSSSSSSSSSLPEIQLSAASLDMINLVLGLELPFFYVMSKMDLVGTEIAVRINKWLLDLTVELRRRLLGISLPPHAVSLLHVSNVTGTGLNNLASHFFRLRPRRNVRMTNFLLEEGFPGAKFLFCLEGSQEVPDVGLVLSGTVAYGALDFLDGSPRNDPIAFYTQINRPDSCIPLRIKSVHRMRLPVHSLFSGQMVTLAVEPVETAEQRPSLIIEKGSILAYYGEERPALPMEGVSVLEADVVANIDDPESAVSLGEPVRGTLYWLGNRWPAQLSSLSGIYGEAKLRAIFRLQEDTVLPIPGTRVIFVGPHFRLEGQAYLPKK